MRQKISAHVHEGLSGGSCVRGHGSKDPHRRERKCPQWFIEPIKPNLTLKCAQLHGNHSQPECLKSPYFCLSGPYLVPISGYLWSLFGPYYYRQYTWLHCTTWSLTWLLDLSGKSRGRSWKCTHTSPATFSPLFRHTNSRGWSSASGDWTNPRIFLRKSSG